MDRRGFLRAVGMASASALGAERAGAAAGGGGDAGEELRGVLVDTTRCVGCRTCELACAEEHGLPPPDIDDGSAMDQRRETSQTQWTVVNRFDTSAGEVFVRKQCMHCNQPACASACLTKAMHKNPSGPVTWDEGKCMGCRFCMVSCPFDVPKFEYGKAIPRIQKCSMCWERLQEGGVPACVENCPAEALSFGTRRELLDLARARIAEAPEAYVHHIYGEREAGGTGWLYLAAAPFGELGFSTAIESTPYPELTTGFLYSVPVVLILWPAFMLGLNSATKPETAQAGEGSR
ncbi:MAG: 4Fe-4S dicluster domain-containing protein [Candidatus Latescibacterota bacterium]